MTETKVCKLYNPSYGITEEEEQSIQEHMGSVYKYYVGNCYGEDWTMACSIHNLFEKKDIESHNCIACNLESTSTLIASYLSNYKNFGSPEYFVPIFILNLYLMVERVEHYCNIMGIQESIKAKYLQNFKLIKKWANFIKHPKSFMFTHHAIHTVRYPYFWVHVSAVSHLLNELL